MPEPKVAFHTLGCKVNQYDSAGMEQLFLERGYQVVGFDEVAEVYVINSCAVTGRSEAKSRQAARRAARQNPRAVVALVGCYPQVDAQAAELPGVQVVAGVHDRHRIVDLVEAAGHPDGTSRMPTTGPEFGDLPAPHFAGRSRALLKIQDGCDGSCTYCIVPAARGPARSRSAESVLRDACRLLEAGYQEIVLTGIRLGAYGRDLGDIDLAGIIARLGELGRFRLRLSSLEPEDVTGRLVEALAASPVICPHLHLPLQSGSDRILASMGRRYRAAGFAQLVEGVRGIWPDAAVTTDVIVGFPGEGAREYEETLALVEKLAFSRLHVFKYSPRPGTPARDFPEQVPAAEKAGRSLALIRLGRRLAHEFHRGFVGRHVEVLVEEEPDRGLLQGLTGHYVRARFAGSSRWCHRLVTVRVTGAHPAGVEGEPVGRDG
ncbi:MAG TPA: tRNA (N(6)-L-threonylcarbamoyladenosine(37)-C(2))-methylthiotransferase MtaB [Clostridiales bacterium UBA8153]|nr:tRNA (N(6)-L-threonylcarbamoyladenosine(37)-C(2))-methylthiotransferase MtaB [Clostridiales bacterium UBA8153]